MNAQDSIITTASVDAIEQERERLISWRIAQLGGEAGGRGEAIVALLAMGEASAAMSLVARDPSESAGSRIIVVGWLVERFMPVQYALAGPLDPWNESVAALQLDIMRVSMALSRRHGRFDAAARVFVQADARTSSN